MQALSRHYWKQNFKATETARKICKVESEGTVSIRAVEKWFVMGDFEATDGRCRHATSFNFATTSLDLGGTDEVEDAKQPTITKP